VLASEVLNPLPSAFLQFSPPFLSGLYQTSGSTDFLVAYVVPCVRFGCIVQHSASFTTATLGLGGWLGLVHHGLSPWKKCQAFLGAPIENVTLATLIRISGTAIIIKRYFSNRYSIRKIIKLKKRG
jgi:hypothetical protein